MRLIERFVADTALNHQGLVARKNVGLIGVRLNSVDGRLFWTGGRINNKAVFIWSRSGTGFSCARKYAVPVAIFWRVDRMRWSLNDNVDGWLLADVYI